MRILCACPIHEGYGQTETTAMTTITFPGDWTTGHVGGVAPVCEVRLPASRVEWEPIHPPPYVLHPNPPTLTPPAT